MGIEPFLFDDIDPSDAAYLDADATLKPATDTLAVFALNDALTASQRRRLQRPGSLAMVVEVTAPEYVDPVTEALRAMSSWDATFTPTGSSRLDEKPEKGNERVGRALARGGRVVGVSHAPLRYLPPALLLAADIRVEIGPLNKDTLSSVIKAATGTRPRCVPNVAGLSFDEICSAIRTEETSIKAVDRLTKILAAKSRSGTPNTFVPFENLVGYGEAHAFGMRLIADVERWRADPKGFSFGDVEKAAVFVGAPGTGKTAMVRSLAQSANLTLVSTSVASWFADGPNGALDGVIRSARAKFDEAMNLAPSVLFLDEIESLPNRSTLSDRAAEWWTSVVNYCLIRIEEILSDPEARVCILAATNYGDKLDPALVRPGRLARLITILPPNSADLALIMRQHLNDALPDADLAPLAELALGATGATIVGWIKSAKALARAAGRDLALDDLATQVSPPDTRPGSDVRRCAYHEAGHCLGAELSGGHVIQTSIIVRGNTGGKTTVARTLTGCATRTELEADVVGLLSGRAAEKILLGSIGGGSGGSDGSDLALATGMLASIHASLGLGLTLSYRAALGACIPELRYDHATRAEVESDLRRLQTEAENLITANVAVVEAIAAELIASRVVSGDTVREIIAAHPSQAPLTGWRH